MTSQTATFTVGDSDLPARIAALWRGFAGKSVRLRLVTPMHTMTLIGRVSRPGAGEEELYLITHPQSNDPTHPLSFQANYLCRFGGDIVLVRRRLQDEEALDMRRLGAEVQVEVEVEAVEE